jgi:hypothetical protein
VNATHAVDVEEIQTTRGEKALAVVLGLFLFVGLVWGYTKLDTRDPFPVPPTLPGEQAAIDANLEAEGALVAAQAALGQARSDLELARERYRTALDAGRPAPGLAAEYREAERELARAQASVASARARVAATAGPARAAVDRRNAEVEEKRTRDERVTFLLRTMFLLIVLGIAYGAFQMLRGSTYFPLGIAAVGAAAILVLVFAGDYVEDRIAFRDTGPFVISLAGIGLAVGAFWSLQRYLRRRIPLRRVRKGECPFCGFPASGNASCEGCGRTIAGSCSHCGEHRRVGVLFCGCCGKA